VHHTLADQSQSHLRIIELRQLVQAAREISESLADVVRDEGLTAQGNPQQNHPVWSMGDAREAGQNVLRDITSRGVELALGRLDGESMPSQGVTELLKCLRKQVQRARDRDVIGKS
jgi:hypothetical protein